MAQVHEDPRIKYKEEWEAYKVKLIKEAETLKVKKSDIYQSTAPSIQNPNPLFNCLDCGKEISKKAFNCPFCGSPINQTQQKVATIELTGKKWKKLNLIAALISIGGLIFSIATKAPVFFLIMLCGICLFIYARIMAWWEHG